ncbi:PREDICTED: crossover junction endonuclease MUS81 [Eufriesea mexicana]|uniref:crossover junction endonuclease MUS81 n=1 Tax=Eufriesea mexicana TaxID=516756 RepID=UPI00083BFF5C|nr:PREDICTED: crossover junction endonuclease MUS81 [Eufriesea mexicana]
MKRIKLKPEKPNPLFEFWLEEWKKEAASRNSDLQHHFSKALVSLKKYPLPLKSGKDCIILQHFGTKLCSMLDKKLEKYKAQNEFLRNENNLCEYCSCNEYIRKRKNKSPQTVINAGSVHGKTQLIAFDNTELLSWDVENYAALLILYKNKKDTCDSGYVTEVDLLTEIKKLCGHASKTSISDLFDSGLIAMIGAPIRYDLTEQGINILEKICGVTTTNVKSINCSEILNKIQISLKTSSKSQTSELMKNFNNENINKSAECITTESCKEQFNENIIRQKSLEGNTDLEKVQGKAKEVKNVKHVNNLDNKKKEISNLQKTIYLEANKFDIILLVDTQETCGGRTKPQHDATIKELTQLDVLFEIRHLKVGDFAWIARCRNKNNELILPYIVERKRIDDLSASITDGRFHEQKFRLKHSGITNLMYIIEECAKAQRLTIPHSSLMQASINTLIQDGFSIKYTKSHKDSMFYLSSLTRILIKTFKGKNLIGCKKEVIEQTDILSNTCNLMEFEEFNKAASKQKVFKVSEMFVRQLIQLKGMSVDKALAIVEHYPTPQLLIEAFQASDCNGELLLANIEFGDRKRSIGSIISKTIYQLYTKKNFN